MSSNHVMCSIFMQQTNKPTERQRQLKQTNTQTKRKQKSSISNRKASKQTNEYFLFPIRQTAPCRYHLKLPLTSRLRYFRLTVLSSISSVHFEKKTMLGFEVFEWYESIVLFAPFWRCIPIFYAINCNFVTLVLILIMTCVFKNLFEIKN